MRTSVEADRGRHGSPVQVAQSPEGALAACRAEGEMRNLPAAPACFFLSFCLFLFFCLFFLSLFFVSFCCLFLLLSIVSLFFSPFFILFSLPFLCLHGVSILANVSPARVFFLWRTHAHSRGKSCEDVYPPAEDTRHTVDLHETHTERVCPLCRV